MSTDIRMSVEFPVNPKTKKLKRRLGADAVLGLMAIWCHAAQRRPDGSLKGMTNEDIAIVADWAGEPDDLVNALVEVGFIDATDDGLMLHDWEENQPWIAGAERRSESAKSAARAKWDKRAKKNDAHAMRVASDSHADAMRDVENRNAPSPYPSPIPSPSPNPNPSPSFPQTPKGESEEKPKRARVKKAEPPAWFSLLWENSPKKTGERDAIAAAHRIEKETPEKGEQIARAWSSYRAFIDAKDGGNYQYIVKAHTFLTEPWRWNAEHWEAELVKLNSKVAPFQRPEKSPYATTDDAIAGFLAKYGGVE